MDEVTITPSILDANFLYLDYEIQKLKKINLKRIHYDVMDYDFVPNLTFGAKILQDIKSKYQDFYFDIHFMVKIKKISVEQFLKPFIQIHPNLMSVHLEALDNNQIRNFLDICSKNDIKKSLALKPETSIDKLLPYLEELNNVLLMTVSPGFGNQKIIPHTIEKIKQLSLIRSEKKYHFTIEVDGGINNHNIKKIIEQGADDLVVGTYLFKSENIIKAYNELKK